MNDKIIRLKNGLFARYKRSRMIKIPQLGITQKSNLHMYDVPCPFCQTMNPAFSKDHHFFITAQINCSHCGIFYRPIADPEWEVPSLDDSN